LTNYEISCIIIKAVFDISKINPLVEEKMPVGMHAFRLFLKRLCMRKVFFIIALVAVVLAGCGSYAMWYRQDGLIPYEHFQMAKNAGERLVLISPVLAQNHRQSGLYIITNPEDILKALDTLGEPGVITPGDLNKALQPFSPVLIQASRDLTTVNPVSDYDISNQDGMAIFSLPSSIDQFFYAYMVINQDYRWGSNDPTKVWVGVKSLPAESQDVYIAFSEEKGNMLVSANINPDAVENFYDSTTGLYGLLLGKKDQTGFIKISLKDRMEISRAKEYKDYFSYSEVVNKYQKTESNTVRGVHRVDSIGHGYGVGAMGVSGSFGILKTYYYVYEVTVTRNWYKRTWYYQGREQKTEMVYNDTESMVLVDTYMRTQ